MIPLERNQCGHPLTGLLWERQFEEILLELGWAKVPNWECPLVHRKRSPFLSVFVDDINIDWQKAASQSHGVEMMKLVDLG